MTGDHPTTAEAIGRSVGILTSGSFRAGTARVIKGPELDTFTSADWDHIATCNELVFARTTPEHKMIIVNEMRKRDKVRARVHLHVPCI